MSPDPADSQPAAPDASVSFAGIRVNARRPLTSDKAIPDAAHRALEDLGALMAHAQAGLLAFGMCQDTRSGLTHLCALAVHPDDKSTAQLTGQGRKIPIVLFLSAEDLAAIVPYNEPEKG